MSRHAALGPIDPQLGQSPAASLIKVVEQKPIAEIDDETLVMADVGRKAIAQVKRSASDILKKRLPPDKADALAELSSRDMNLRLSPVCRDRKRARPAGEHRYAG